ncbi:hypothetical protein IU450_13200 [Nocardia abscessus]|uniref:hypothetical protein n=1 Tax=Nocardia abscessus TaxID=120957 RepID=UPI001894C3F3|nr:hypothetical protein [Nocardia abscessus]MBF6336841.1 hypothetical protein [Nocardia abscessus]
MMAARGRITDEIRAYRSYTGESAQAARQIRPPAHRTSIPAAVGDQMLLEAEILVALIDSRNWTVHPFAISRVRPQRDGIVLWVDERVAAFGRTYDAATDVLYRLVPYADENGSFVAGVAGLRLGRHSGRNIELRMAGTSGVVVLRCAPHASWRAAIDTVRTDLEASDHRPLWDTGCTVGASERRFIGWQIDAFPQFAWLGSALLRRLHLFRSASRAFYTKGWCCNGRFKLELNSTAGIGSYHRQFIDCLTDSGLGIPLATKDIDCYCDSLQTMQSCTCWIELGPRTGDAILQLRFSHNPRTIQFRPEFESIGADSRWLDIVLPPRADH